MAASFPRPSPLLLLALTFSFPAAAGSARPSDVMELGDVDFDYQATEHETMLLMFYAPWCGHCKKLTPDFEKAAGRLKGTVQLAKVDCTAHAHTCSRFGVSGYPALKIFRNGRDSGPYDGPRSAEGMYEVMRRQTGPDSVLIQTEEDLHTFINHYEASVIGVFPHTDSPQLEEFLKAAAILREQFRFAHTHTLMLVEKYGLNTQGVLLFRPPRLSNKFEENFFIFTEFLTISSLRRFIRDNIFGLCPHMTMENRERLRVRDLLTVFYDVDYLHNPLGTNYWRNRVMKVASQFKGRGLSFSVANQREFQGELQQDFGLSTAETLPLVTIRTRLGYKYTMREEFTRDGKSLERFLEDYFSERLKRYVKSEPVPERQTGAVRVVVAEVFDEVVNNPQTDVLIQFYSPVCPHCKNLEPIYTELAIKLSSDPLLVISKMNAVDNDVPPGYDVQGFPTIYFAPAGRKDEPIRYEGSRELKDLLKFLKREASHQLIINGHKQEL